MPTAEDQAPEDPNDPAGMEEIVRFGLLGVWEPIRLVSVIIESRAILQFAWKVALMVLLAFAKGLLWPMLRVTNVGTITKSGFSPRSTPKAL
jgi:hypothetical protein